MTTLKAGGLDFSDIGAKRYSPTMGRTLRVQPFMPQFRYSELYYGKRYKSTKLSQFAHAGKP